MPREMVTQKVRSFVYEEIPFSWNEIVGFMETVQVNKGHTFRLNMGRKNFTLTVKRNEDTEDY